MLLATSQGFKSTIVPQALIKTEFFVYCGVGKAMFNNSLRGAVGAGVISSLLVLTGCGTSSASATDQARKKTPVNNPSSTPTTTTTTTTATTTLVASASNPLTGQSPGVGAPDIATTDHNVNNDLTPMPLPATETVVGAFRFICAHTTLATDDPTVYPGQPGKSHLHDETGVHGWNASSNYGNLRQSGGGSECNNVAGFDQNQAESSWAANRTPYWQPALLDGKGNAIQADFIVVYYKRRPSTDPIVSDPNNPQYQGKAVSLPNGIKYIFGAFPEDPAKTPDTQVMYLCTGGASGAIYEGSPTNPISFAEAISCAKSHSDGTFEVRMDGPDCWDGVNLDSADHRSHLAYGSYGSWGYRKCDAQHPYVIPQYTYAASWTILPTDNGDIHFASDEMDNTKPRGWSFHVDYGPAAWDPTVLAAWTNNCIEKLLSCNSGNLGNGFGLKGAAEPIYYNASNNTYVTSWRNPNRLVPIPATSTQ
jgi:hypothetical protein